MENAHVVHINSQPTTKMNVVVSYGVVSYSSHDLTLFDFNTSIVRFRVLEDYCLLLEAETIKSKCF